MFDAPLGDPGQSGEPHRQLVGCHRQGLAVEVAAADHFTTLRIHKDQRVVGCTVQFEGSSRAHLCDRVANRAVYLRGAAQAIGVLHSRVALGRAMRFADLAAAVQARQIACRGRRARVGASPRDALVERRGAAAQRVERQRRGHVGRIGEDCRLAQPQHQQGQHPLRAVQQRQALFGLQSKRRNARAAQRVAPRKLFSARDGFAFANDHLRQMRQRSQVARRSDRTLRWDHRMNAPVQHCAKCLHDDRPHPTQALRQRVRAQQHHSPRFGFAERSAHTAGVATHQVELQLADLIRRDAHLGQFPKAGVHTIDGCV